MESLPELFESNRRWAAAMIEQDPKFFERLAEQQAPKHLWIGCSDSRVPANQITGLMPGEIFVHRNIANVVVHTDFNLLSVVQFAVDVLKIEHIIVCGHYGCGGVMAALDNSRHGLVDNWLRHIQNLARRRSEELAELSPGDQLDRLCEINVIAQAENLSRTTVVQDAWDRGQSIDIHSWIYRLSDGHLRNLAAPINGK
ncbi:MAG: carbonate dehydratase [Akkermansiaceae bacterium]|jgi:carbonic anhydrase|nr:carbonate dehydratase [Akkermansiaceae bacterium]|tara:strand:- start:492 stop:1088 length:597 start_codon:yes stop_codon:yes gene_type:complete